MSSERMIRVDNLKLLKKQLTLTDKDIAVAVGLAEKSAGRIGKILAGKLPFTEDLRERIEKAYGLTHKWLDEVHDGAEYSEESEAEIQAIRAAQAALHKAKGGATHSRKHGGGHSDEAQDLSHAKITDNGTTAQRAPFIEWGRLVVELFVSNEVVQAERSLPVPGEASDKCKWTQVEQDHPRLRIMRGDVIALDPVGDATPLLSGKVYLFQDETGALILAEYRPLANKDFEAIPDSGLPLEKKRHGLKVLARKRGTWE